MGRKTLAFILAVSLLFSRQGLIVFAEDQADDADTPVDAFMEVSESADPISEAETDMAEISDPQLSTPTDTQETDETVTDATESVLTETAYVFDPQPTTMEEVREAVDAYEAAYEAALADGGFLAALEVQKPRWQYEVAEELMPDGWRCDSLVDVEYDVTSWTIFPVPVALSAQIATVLELQAEIDAAGEQAVIILDDGFSFDGTVVTIPLGKDITIKSEGNAVTLTQAYADTRHFIADGQLTLENIILDGSTDGTAEAATGGGVQINSGSFTMSGDSVIQYCKAGNGGGVYAGAGDAVLSGVVVTGSSAEQGGGVYAGGSLTLIDCAILENRASAMGGGVYASGSLSILDSKINNNRVETSVSARGGGVYAAGTLDIKGAVEITGNRVYNPATVSVTHLGGGIYAAGALNIEGYSPGSVVIGNNHIDGANINTSASGGGIYAAGGAIIRNALVSGNSTKRIGGGISVGTGKNLTLDNTVVSGNWTTYSHSTSEGGGGIYMAGVSNSAVTLTMQGGAKITGNGMDSGGTIRTSYGGGIMSAYDLLIAGGEISGNAAKNNAGGIEVYFGTQLTLSDTLVKGNWSENGGGVYFGANGGYSNVTLFFKNGARIIGNGINKNGAVTTNYGGGVSSYGNPYYNLTLTIDASGNGGVDSIAGNKAKTFGGGVYYSNNLKLIDVTLSDNSAPDGGGVYVETQCYDNTNADGYVYAKAITIFGGVISNNTASGNGGGICAVQTEFNNRSSLTINISGTTVNGNTAGGSGGGIYNGMPYKPYFASQYTYRLAAGVKTDNGTIITGNTAQINGGGICLDAGNPTVYVGKKTVSAQIGEGTVITDNKASTGSGGGIYMVQHENLSSAPDTVFSGNQAAWKEMPDPYTALAFPAIRYATTSLMDNNRYVHPLNNYDVNPRNVTHFVVKYYPNGGDGAPYEDVVAHPNPSGEHLYTILAPEAAGISRTGAGFAGWNTQPDGSGAAYNPGSLITYNSDNNKTLELYAQWQIYRYTVTFYDENGSTVLSSLEYDHGDFIDLPDNPVKEPDAQYSYSFAGWQAGGSYTVSDPVTQDMSFTADYEATIKTFTVSFESNGGSAVGAISGIEYGASITAPTNPTRANYSFSGWYRDNDTFQSAWDFEKDAVTGDITLFAKWKSLPGGSGNNDGDRPAGRRNDDEYYPADNTGYTLIEDQPIPLTSNPYTGRMQHNPAYAFISMVISCACILGGLLIRKKKYE